MVNPKPHLYVFVGCGGVGKTTVSAAWSLALAQQGVRVALITIDPARRLAQSLGLETLGGELTQTPLSPNLWAMMLDREHTSTRLVQRFAPTHEHVSKIKANRYFNIFSRSLAGAQEMMALHEVHDALHCGRFDVVVLDTPPSQHTLELLEVPQRLRVALDGPALQWLSLKSFDPDREDKGWRSTFTGLSKTVALKAFTKLTSAPFLEELFEFLNLFGDVLRALKEQSSSVEQWLAGPHTSIWLVTSPAQSHRIAGEHLRDTLEKRGYRVGRWLVNRTPLLLCALGLEISLSQLVRLSETSRAHLEELGLSIHPDQVEIWRQEIDRALEAASELNHLEPSSLILLEELSTASSPIEHIQALAHFLTQVDLSSES